MTAFLIVFGLTSFAASIAFLIGGVKMIARQVNADDCILDWEDCL